METFSLKFPFDESNKKGYYDCVAKSAILANTLGECSVQ